MNKEISGQMVNEEALERLSDAASGVDQNEKRRQKAVGKCLAGSEVMIAKCMATLASRGCENLTPELVRVLSILVVSAIERYADLPEDKQMLLDAVHANIDGFYQALQDSKVQTEHPVQEQEEVQEESKIILS